MPENEARAFVIHFTTLGTCGTIPIRNPHVLALGALRLQE